MFAVVARLAKVADLSITELVSAGLAPARFKLQSGINAALVVVAIEWVIVSVCHGTCPFNIGSSVPSVAIFNDLASIAPEVDIRQDRLRLPRHPRVVD